jgi:hypothetical protein
MNRIRIFDVEESESLTKNLLRTLSIIEDRRSRAVYSMSNDFAEAPRASPMLIDYGFSMKNVND